MILAGCSGAVSTSAAALTATSPAFTATVTTTEPAATTPGPTRSPAPVPAELAGTPEDFPGRLRPRSVVVPILLYHHVSVDTPQVRYTIAAQRFEEQLDYLADHGYETITIQDLVNAIRAGVALPRQPVILTFDDGNQDLFDLAFPAMQARGMVGVAYVVGNRIGAEGFLGAESLQALRRAGWEIGSHGMAHRALNELDEKDMATEVGYSKTVIETALGEPIHSFAYPFGIVTQEGVLAVIEAGYTSGAGLGLWNVHRPDGVFYLSRREVHGMFELEDFAALLKPD